MARRTRNTRPAHLEESTRFRCVPDALRELSRQAVLRFGGACAACGLALQRIQERAQVADLLGAQRIQIGDDSQLIDRRPVVQERRLDRIACRARR